MSVPLTLGLPKSRDRRGLTDRLLLPTTSAGAVGSGGSHIGPAVVPAAEWRASSGPVVVVLDAESDRLPTGEGIVGYTLDVDSDRLGDALGLDLPAPLTIFTDLDPDLTRAITDAGHSAGIAASAPVEQFADFLAVVSHTDVGFVARAHSAHEVMAVLAATVAALRGNDIRAALTHVDNSAVLALNPAAGEAVREVLRGIEIGDVDAATAELIEIGLLN